MNMKELLKAVPASQTSDRKGDKGDVASVEESSDALAGVVQEARDGHCHTTAVS